MSYGQSLSEAEIKEIFVRQFGKAPTGMWSASPTKTAPYCLGLKNGFEVQVENSEESGWQVRLFGALHHVILGPVSWNEGYTLEDSICSFKAVMRDLSKMLEREPDTFLRLK